MADAAALDRYTNCYVPKGPLIEVKPIIITICPPQWREQERGGGGERKKKKYRKGESAVMPSS